MKRRDFLRNLSAGGAGLAAANRNAPGHSRSVFVSSGVKKTSVSELVKPVAIAMWDFSWILRHHRYGEFNDWDRAFDGLAERGYNAIRMDCMPQFVASDANGSVNERLFCAKGNWSPALWGNNVSTYIQPRQALLEFLPKCFSRNIQVGLATWFLEHGSGIKDIFYEKDGLFRAWDETLSFLDKNGLLKNILYVDVLNEYPFWHGYEWLKTSLNERTNIQQFKEKNPNAHIPDPGLAEKKEKFNPLQKEFYNSFLTNLLVRLKKKWPDLAFFASLDSGMPLADIDLSAFGALDYHIWFVHNEAMSNEGYSKISSMANESEFEKSYALLKDCWKSNRETLVRWMGERVRAISQTAAAHRIPCGNTEGWGPIMWIDHPLLDWEWVKEAAEICVELALENRYKFICTSNFTHPQFSGLWDDVKWHKKMTAAIRNHLRF